MTRVVSGGLPVDAALPELTAALRAGRNAVLEAPPGAGKSTIVPLVLLEEPWAAGRRILLLEPRRLAARAVAQRMATLLGEQVGATVGYRMRFETRVGPATRLEVLTEGVFTRLLQEDAALEGVAAVIFDEVHERSLIADLGLALALDSQANVAPALRLLVMSATLDGARVAALLDAPRVQAAGRTFDVRTIYAGRGAPLLSGAAGRVSQDPAQRVAALLRTVCDETQGDILTFLPGAPEIRRVQQLLGGRLPPAVRVLPLYGELSREAQDVALAPAPPPQRRLLLSTNVAETSLTIEGVRVVVDSGLVRRSVFDPGTGMSRLETQAVSRASADQRRGRAGRVADGVCYRLWSEGAQAGLAAHSPPEILSTDLAALALDLAAWGVADPATLRWLDPPPAAAFAQARELLARLGALDTAGRVTAHGRAMAREPVHPRLAHMLIRARARGAGRLGAELAALLSERDLLRTGARDADIVSRLALVRHGARAGATDDASLQRVRRAIAQLMRGDARERNAVSRSGGDEQAGVLLALAFPDRIGQRRGDGAAGTVAGAAGAVRYLLANGRGAVFASPDALARAPYIVALDLDDVDVEARVRLAAAVDVRDLEDVFAAAIQESQSVHWDTREEAVSARRQRRLGALVLEDKPLSQPAPDALLAAMLEGVRALGIGALPWDDATRQLQARLEFVRGLGAAARVADWPASDDATLAATAEDWLAPWLDDVSRRAHLARVPLRQALLARLSHAQQRQLAELAPPELRAPTGSMLAVDYTDASAPSVSVRLQELFGLATTPRVGGGRVALTLKLLSPARRPVQITRDLEGFWRGSYAEVRKDLRGRYPKHYWPENPLEAEPTRGVKRRPPRDS